MLDYVRVINFRSIIIIIIIIIIVIIIIIILLFFSMWLLRNYKMSKV